MAVSQFSMMLTLTLIAIVFATIGVIYFSYKNQRVQDKFAFGILEGIAGVAVIASLFVGMMNE